MTTSAAVRRLDSFALVLVTDHACPLRCGYCYTGAKTARPMPVAVGREAIRRAVRSIRPGGRLDLGFFGGEPLLRPGLLEALADEAARLAGPAGVDVRLGLTTSGTPLSAAAWRFVARPDLDLAVSCDGLPEVHDRYRRAVDGRSTSAEVYGTLSRLVATGKDFRVVMVVRPDTAATLADGVTRLRAEGVRHFEPTLDLWTSWTSADLAGLEAAIDTLASAWFEGLPDGSVSWFDEALARLARVPVESTARCGFGRGSLAVAPSGRLYPCERLVGDDTGHGPRLPGHVGDGNDFLSHPVAACPPTSGEPGGECPCSNYLRTGDPGQPDDLLRRVEAACARAVLRQIGEVAHVRARA